MNAPPQFSPKADIPHAPPRAGSSRRLSRPARAQALSKRRTPERPRPRRGAHGGLHLLNTRAV